MSEELAFYPPMDVGEQQTLGFDYGLMIGGATISSATVTCVVVQGVDPNAANCVIGSPTIIPSRTTGALLQGVSFLAGNMTGGVTYQFICTATISDGQVLIQRSDCACNAIP